MFKKVFDRPKDIADILAILVAQKGRLDLERVKADARAFLADGSYGELEALIARFG